MTEYNDSLMSSHYSSRVCQFSSKGKSLKSRGKHSHICSHPATNSKPSSLNRKIVSTILFAVRQIVLLEIATSMPSTVIIKIVHIFILWVPAVFVEKTKRLENPLNTVKRSLDFQGPREGDKSDLGESMTYPNAG